MIVRMVFSPEVHFWNSRLRNLEHIYEQLRDERVRKMAVILERTDSAYWPSFKSLFRNIVAGEGRVLKRVYLFIVGKGVPMMRSLWPQRWPRRGTWRCT